MINYFLKRIALLGMANKYSAQIKTSSSLNVEDIIDEMEGQGSTVGKADIISVLHSFHVAITKLLQRGHAITTPIANYKPGIKGVFENADDRFDRLLRAAAGIHDLATGQDRALHGGAIGGFGLLIHVPALDHPGPAMNDDRPAGPILRSCGGDNHEGSEEGGK